MINLPTYLSIPEAHVPTRAYEGDAGLDLYSTMNITLGPWTSYTIDTGVHVRIPEGYCGVLISKSGLNVKSSITTTGLIDQGFRGSINVKMYNNSSKPVAIRQGQKISQLVVMPYLPVVPVLVDEPFTDDTERGTRGFGSSDTEDPAHA